MLFVHILLHSGELSHVDEASIKDDFSLRLLFGSLEAISLDLAFILESQQELLSHIVAVAKDDSLVALAICQGQLLDCNLILFRLPHRQPVIGRRIEWRKLFNRRFGSWR